MREAITIYGGWLLSVTTIALVYLTGQKYQQVWLLQLGNQCLWTAYILATRQYGLMPMNAVLWVLYARNHRLWNPKPTHRVGQSTEI